MGSLPILFIIHTIAIGIVLSFHDGSNGHGRKTLCVNRPSISAVFADGTAVTKKKLHMESVHFYWPQRSCGQGNIFTPVCHSVHKGGRGCT